MAMNEIWNNEISPLYISLRYNVHMALSHANQFAIRLSHRQNVRDNVNRSVFIVQDSVKLRECLYTSNVFSINPQNGNLKTVWRAVGRDVCVCVWVGCQWSIFCCWKMAVIYMKRNGSVAYFESIILQVVVLLYSVC